METFLIRALQLIMSLSLLVIIHEGGHFLFARLFKTRVEKFCLFFDPWFTLFKFKPKNSETEYGIGWLPLGGYVKIAGMIDESMDTEQMKQPVQPWEFRAKPAWQRLLIMVGGVLFNFILALFIYSMILFTWGSEYVPLQKVALGMDFNETAKAVGFRDGDILVSADGVPLERYNSDMLTSIVDARQVTVLRNGSEASIYIPEDMMERLLADSVRFASFRTPFVIDSIPAGTPASLAGLLPGDNITQTNQCIARPALSVYPQRRYRYTDTDQRLLIQYRSIPNHANIQIAAYRERRIQLLRFYPCRNIPGSKHAERLRQPDEVSFLQRGR